MFSESKSVLYVHRIWGFSLYSVSLRVYCMFIEFGGLVSVQ